MTARLFIAALIAVACPAQTTAWPTYNGDYSGRRFSPLTQINSTNVQKLAPAWSTKLNGGRISGTPLMVDGVLYATALDHVWAIDARNGREIWHYYRESKGDMPRTGNRGVAIYKTWLFFVTLDNNLVSLDAATGKQRFLVNFADPKQLFFSTVAPLVIRNHVIIATGGDSLDIPAFIQAHDPETGAQQWKWRVTPRPGEPGATTWPNEYAASAGGGHPWLTGTYDPDLNLYYVGTGNPDPVGSGVSRKGDNLYTCSIVALNPDTGKLVWHFQVSPHDTHDWDAVQTPVLIDAPINGKPRKLLAQAGRNGYFTLLDRTNGKNVLTTKLLPTLNWSKGLNKNGQPIPDPAKEPRPDGTLVSPPTSGATNWPPPSFSPQTGLVYVGINEGFSLYYLTDPDQQPQGFAFREAGLGGNKSALVALDYKTGEPAWKHYWRSPGGPNGILTTAGNLLITGHGNYLIAFDAAKGKTLWHATLESPLTNGPITYLLDGKQYIIAAAGDTLRVFTLATN